MSQLAGGDWRVGRIAVAVDLGLGLPPMHPLGALCLQIRQELVDTARRLSADVDREIIGEIETMEALAASPSLQRGDFAAFQQQAEAPLTWRGSGNFALVDRSGRQLLNTSVAFGTFLPKIVNQEAVERALAIGLPQVTGLFTSTVMRELLNGRDNGTLNGRDNAFALSMFPCRQYF